MVRLMFIALLLVSGCGSWPTRPQPHASAAIQEPNPERSPLTTPPWIRHDQSRPRGRPSEDPGIYDLEPPGSLLLQTLHAIGGRTTFQLGSRNTSEPRADTPEGTHDGSDGSYDEGRSDGDGFDPEGCGPPSLAYEVGYRFEPVTTQGTIDFVRVRIRARRAGAIPEGEYGIVQGLVEGMGTMGAPVQLPYGTWTEASWDFPVDWKYGAPWTPELVNAASFGFDLTINGVDCEDYILGEVSEITVEIWGQPLPAAPTIQLHPGN